VRVELEAENVVSSYNRIEHDACVKCLPNEGAGARPESSSVSIGDLWPEINSTGGTGGEGAFVNARVII
jgi:hypothetical protein